MQICYDGDAFRRVLALASTPEQRDRAALALTRLECTGNESSPLERKRVNEWRAEVLDCVDIDELAGFQRIVYCCGARRCGADWPINARVWAKRVTLQQNKR